MNNCVGKKNYRYFICFVTNLCCLALFAVIGLIAWASSGNKKSDSKYLNSLLCFDLFGVESFNLAILNKLKEI